MKIVIKVEDKDWLSVDFNFYLNGKDTHDYIFAMKKIPKEEQEKIKQQIKDFKFQIKFEGTLIILETEDKYYSFDASNFDSAMERSRGHDIAIGFAFIDENDKIIREKISFTKIS
jgi:hypothetical protein